MKFNLKPDHAIIHELPLPEVVASDAVKKLDQLLCTDGEITKLFVQFKADFVCYHLKSARYFKHAFAFRIPGVYHSANRSDYMLYILDQNDKVCISRYECQQKKIKNIRAELIKFTNDLIKHKTSDWNNITGLDDFANPDCWVNRDRLTIYFNNMLDSLKADIRLPLPLQLKPRYIDGDNLVFSLVSDNAREIHIGTNGYQRKAERLEDEPTVLIDAEQPMPDWIVRDFRFQGFIFNLVVSRFKEDCRDMIMAYQSMYRRFLELLDSETVDFIRACKNQSLKESFSTLTLTSYSYNWINAADPAKKSRRMQAYQSYPLPIKACIVQNETSLHQTIDQSAPLSGKISELFGVPEHVLKLIKNIPDNKEYEFLSLLTSRLGRVSRGESIAYNTNREYWPNRGNQVSVEQQWKQFLCMIQVEQRWSMENSGIGIYSNNQHVWKHAEKMLMAKLISEDDLTGARDMIGAFKRQVMFPLFSDAYLKTGWVKYDHSDTNNILCECGPGDTSMLEQVLTGNLSPTQIIGISRDWHERRERIEQIINSSNVDLDQAWQQLVPAQKFGELDIIPLTSKAMLRNEGIRLNHCVVNYADACNLGRSAIFAIQMKGEPVSTLELHIRLGEKKVSIVQNRADKNATPEKNARDAGVWLESQINSGELSVNWQELKEYFKATQIKAHDQSIVSDIGYDPENWLIREQVFDAWKPMMPKTVQKYSYQEWLDKMNLSRAIRNGLIQKNGSKRVFLYYSKKIIWFAKKISVFKR